MKHWESFGGRHACMLNVIIPATLKTSSIEFGRSMSFGVDPFPLLFSLGWCPWIVTLTGTGLLSGLEFPVFPAISK